MKYTPQLLPRKEISTMKTKPKHSKRDMERAVDEAAAVLRESGGRERLMAQTLLMQVCADIMAGKYDAKVQEIKNK